MAQIIKDITEKDIEYIAQLLNNKGVICFPTETVYALAADASSDEAVKRIFEIKKREQSKPFSVLVGDIYQAKRIVQFNALAHKLAVHFMPGPITLVLNTKPHNNLSKYINPDLGTVGIRMPSHSLSLKILKAMGRPIVGTSANISGKDGETNPQEIIKTLGDKVDLIVDQGETELKMGSTIVDLTDENNIKILREGSIPREKIEAVIKKGS